MLVEFILPAGTTIHRNGIPVTLKSEVRCEAHVANLGIIFGASGSLSSGLATQAEKIRQGFTQGVKGFNLGEQKTTNGSCVMCNAGTFTGA